MTTLRPRTSTCLYVGDSLAYDVAGAHTAGLQAAWLRDDDRSPAPYHPEYVLDSLTALPPIVSAPDTHRREGCYADR
jgi:FMN phosphatase YigB (HAD superfamily)